MNRELRQQNIQYGSCRTDRRKKESRWCDIANNVYTLFAIQSEEYKKAILITGQNTTEILFKYIFYTNNKKTLGVLLVNNFAEELSV